MQTPLDIRTLSVTSGIVSLCLSICMLYIVRYRKTYAGFSQWVTASFYYSIGMITLSLRGSLPDLFTIVIANTLIVVGNGKIGAGLEIFLNSKRRSWLFSSLYVLITLVLLYGTFIDPNVILRIVAISIVMAVIYAYCAYITHHHIPQYMTDRNVLLTIVFVVQAVWALYRLVATVYLEPRFSDFMLSAGAQSMSFLVFIGGSIFIIVGLIVLNQQRVEQDLIDAHKEITTLQGIIPICSICKKIRNDEGDWDQLERYIQSHSEAEFSHSICPDCMKRDYPELSD